MSNILTLQAWPEGLAHLAFPSLSSYFFQHKPLLQPFCTTNYSSSLFFRSQLTYTSLKGFSGPPDQFCFQEQKPKQLINIINEMKAYFSLVCSSCSRQLWAAGAVLQHQILVCGPAEHGFHSHGPRELRTQDSQQAGGPKDGQAAFSIRKLFGVIHTSSTSILLDRNQSCGHTQLQGSLGN